MVQQAKESLIKYVTIEMIKNNEKNLVAKSIQSGLFKGIRLEQIDKTEGAAPDVFMLIQVEEKTLLVLCLKYYNILSLERFDGATKTITYFRASEEEQEKAFDLSAEIVNELHEAGRTVSEDAKIIDVGTYAQVPDVIKASSGGSKLKEINKHAASTRAASASRSTYTVHKPKEKEPSIIKRTTKKPTKAMLETMAGKIKAISEGTLKVELPEIEGDTDDEKNEATTAVNEDYTPEYFMCG